MSFPIGLVVFFMPLRCRKFENYSKNHFDRLIKTHKVQQPTKTMSEEAKTKSTQNLGPVAADLHRLLKMQATGEGKSLKAFLEEHLGPVVGWTPANPAAELATAAQ